MQPFEVIGQADQVPFPADFGQPTQEKLPKAQNRFDDPKHWLDRAAPLPIASLAFGRSEFLSHRAEHRLTEPAPAFDLVLGSVIVAAGWLRNLTADCHTDAPP